MLSELLTITLLGAELFWNREFRHDRARINIVYFHLIHNLLCILQCLWNITEYLCHLFRRLQPLLLGVVHTILIVNKVVGAHAYQMVVCFGVLLFHKVYIVGSNHLYAILLGKLYQHRVYLFLHLIYLLVSSVFCRLMTLNLNVIIFSKQIFIPLDSFLYCSPLTFAYFRYTFQNFAFAWRTIHGRAIPPSHSCHYLLWQLATKASRTTNQSFVVLF